MPLSVPSFAQFRSVYQRAVDRAPEAFSGDVLRNLVDGQWRDIGDPSTMVTPVDGTETVALSKVGASDGDAAVEAAARAHRDWAATPLADRKARVGAAVDAHDRRPGPARAAAGLGDRQAVAAGLRRRRPRPGRRALVPGRDRGDARHRRRRRPVRAHAAVRAGQQHRQLELPDERAGARRAGAAARRATR